MSNFDAHRKFYHCTSVCENCLHRSNERIVKETLEHKARAVTDEVTSASSSSKIRMEPVIFTEKTKKYVLGINVEKKSVAAV